jgi:hypothetical protein
MSRTGVGVEKLAQREFAEIASRQEALQTIFPNLLDIFYHPIFAFFQENRLFQHPPLLPTVIRNLSLSLLVLVRFANGEPREEPGMRDDCFE